MLKEYFVNEIDKMYLRDLIADAKRCEEFVIESDGVYCDFAR